jgi:hypothetical protein
VYLWEVVVSLLYTSENHGAMTAEIHAKIHAIEVVKTNMHM